MLIKSGARNTYTSIRPPATGARGAPHTPPALTGTQAAGSRGGGTARLGMDAMATAANAQADRLAKLPKPQPLDIHALCTTMLDGLDEDALTYLVETAAPEGELEIEQEDFEELVVPMLLDAEMCEDEDEAQAKFAQLWAKLTAGGAGSQVSSSEPKMLTGTVSLKAQAKEYEDAAAAQAAHFDSAVQETLNKEIDTKAVDDVEDGGLRDPKAEANAAARCERLTAEVIAETQSLEKEMAEAREAAAQMRTDGQGSVGLGAIETGTFDLPNPGGGADLLSNASVVLVSGRRYGCVVRLMPPCCLPVYAFVDS